MVNGWIGACFLLLACVCACAYSCERGRDDVSGGCYGTGAGLHEGGVSPARVGKRAAAAERGASEHARIAPGVKQKRQGRCRRAYEYVHNEYKCSLPTICFSAGVMWKVSS